MRNRLGFVSGLCLLLVMAVAATALASTAEIYFTSDRNGQNRVTNVQEGDEIWIAVYDPDENIDCDVRDKIWTDVKLMDPKTGAFLAWVSYLDENGDADHHLLSEPCYVPYKGHFPGATAGWLGADYLEETGADTSLFVSNRPFQIGTREDYGVARMNTHVVDDGISTLGNWPNDFLFGNFLYVAGERNWIDDLLNDRDTWDTLARTAADAPIWPDNAIRGLGEPWNTTWLVGRFENMDTLVGFYQDPDDDTDVAVSMMKITDTEATITWDQEIYKDANTSATITVVDADENLNCNQVEYVPVFILVNPGSWNPVDGKGDNGGRSPTNFCMLKRTGGVQGPLVGAGVFPSTIGNDPIRWYNIYHSEINAFGEEGAEDGRYYIQYPTELSDPDNVVWFDTLRKDGLVAVSFYAQETGVNTGVFQLNLNSILEDLQFRSLEVRDVLVAYYLDPNDEDDFKLATAYIEERNTSITSFTDASRQDREIYWIGRDSVYVQVVDANANVDPCCPEQVVVHLCDPHEEDDAEWIVLDETSSNSPVFFTYWGLELLPVWDALGVGMDPEDTGGYQLVLDNWRLEVFNEDEIYARYNDAYYGAPAVHEDDLANNVSMGLAGLGDSDIFTSFPPLISNGSSTVTTAEVRPQSIGGSPGIRVPNDVSFDLVSIADTQVYDGQTTNLYFLDRQGNRVSGYVNSDCVFVEVVDPDQDEDQQRRERIDAFWDGGTDALFGPAALNPFGCDYEQHYVNAWNRLLGDTNIFNNSPDVDLSYAIYDLEGEVGVGSEDVALEDVGAAKVYVLNPRNGRWAGLDLLETGVATGDFVSVTCVDLTAVYTCVPTLGVLPGDTIVAVYQDPSNHSDSAWISIKVGIGGGTTPPSQASTTQFVDANGNEVTAYAQGEPIYVRVTDLSHTQDVSLLGAVVIDGVPYDLTTYGSQSQMFITDPIELDLAAGETITATYTDPTDPTDTSSATVTIVAGELAVEGFYASPNPFADEVTFGYHGSGIASVMSVEVYDLAGHRVWSDEQANASQIAWDGTNDAGAPLANGGYIYVVTATDGTNTFQGKGVVFVNR